MRRTRSRCGQKTRCIEWLVNFKFSSRHPYGGRSRSRYGLPCTCTKLRRVRLRIELPAGGLPKLLASSRKARQNGLELSIAGEKNLPGLPAKPKTVRLINPSASRIVVGLPFRPRISRRMLDCCSFATWPVAGKPGKTSFHSRPSASLLGRPVTTPLVHSRRQYATIRNSTRPAPLASTSIHQSHTLTAWISSK
jgi:hypothetical protein